MRPAPRGGRQVVRVHDDVHEGVEDASEGDVPSGEEPHRRPHVQGHQKVVGDVQEGHLQVRGDRDSGFFKEKNGKAMFGKSFFFVEGGNSLQKIWIQDVSKSEGFCNEKDLL